MKKNVLKYLRSLPPETTSLITKDPEGTELISYLPDKKYNHEKESIRKIEIEGLLSSIPEIDAKILTRRSEGYRFKEIASEIGKSIDYVRTREKVSRCHLLFYSSFTEEK